MCNIVENYELCFYKVLNCVKVKQSASLKMQREKKSESRSISFSQIRSEILNTGRSEATPSTTVQQC